MLLVEDEADDKSPMVLKLTITMKEEYEKRSLRQ